MREAPMSRSGNAWQRTRFVSESQTEGDIHVYILYSQQDVRQCVGRAVWGRDGRKSVALTRRVKARVWEPAERYKGAKRPEMHYCTISVARDLHCRITWTCCGSGVMMQSTLSYIKIEAQARALHERRGRQAYRKEHGMTNGEKGGQADCCTDVLTDIQTADRRIQHGMMDGWTSDTQASGWMVAG
eukprot:364101-Chlamydomonas_euryale.AAC.3